MRTREQIIGAIQDRRAIYLRLARETRDPAKQERMTHTADAFEILLGELGVRCKEMVQ